MSKVNPIVTTLCPVCQGDKKIFGEDCTNCEATGFIHREIVLR